MADAAAVRAREDATAGLRIAPHSIEAEQAVLGGLLLDNPSWDQVADLLHEEDFYRPEHRLIFAAIRTLADAGQPFDILTVSEALERQGQLASAGGFAYLGDLADNTPSAANIVAYAGIVRDRAVLRALAETGTAIANSAWQTEGRDAAELLDEAERRIFHIANLRKHRQGGFTRIDAILTGVMERIDELYHAPSAVTGVPTGFQDLDLKTSGLQEGDLVIVAGRPSMGKTAFAMNIAEHAAISERRPVAVFSLEMPAEQLTMRLLSSLSRVDQHRIRTGRLDEDDWPRITSALSILQDAPIFINDTPALTPGELRAQCRRLQSELQKNEGAPRDLELVVVDYLQLMQAGGSRENRAVEISEISRSLKALAKELSVPVVALSQLNRGLEQRTNKRPMMSDLRESGAIEQDADVIIFIYRDEVYDEDSPDRGVAEIIISKQRNGPIGTVKLTFLNHITKFESLAREEDYYPVS